MIEDPTLLALLGALSEGDGDDPIGDIVHTLDKFDALEDPQLASVMCTKEGLAKMKERMVVDDPLLRSVYICRLGRLIVRTWLVVNADSFDIEGYVRVESRTESRRMIEDFMDMAVDLMKNFASGALGRAPAADSSQTFTDNIACSSAYCEVLCELLNCYNNAFEELDTWSDALVGVSGSGSQSIHTSSKIAIRSNALSLLPLIKPALSIAFRDRYLLINRCRQLPSYRYAALRLVSSFMRTLLSDVSGSASILTELDSAVTESGAGQMSIFGSGGGSDPTEASRMGSKAVPVQQYVSEWVNTYLLNFVIHHSTAGSNSGGLSAVEMCAILRDIICITQHRLMSLARHQVSGE